jgi:hypothetical protein
MKERSKNMEIIKNHQDNICENSEARDNIGYDKNHTERGDHTEIDQPNPSIATPGIPEELPAREIR